MIPILRPTWVEIDLSILKNNLTVLRSKIPETTLLMAVVKADAYGHGLTQYSQMAAQNGADWLGVAIPEEGVALREAGITLPILVLGAVNRTGAHAAAQYALTQAVFDAQTVVSLNEIGKPVNVHLKIDSGMGRIGCRTPGEILRVLRAIDEAENVTLTGVFTHFATSDNDSLDYVREQFKRFLALMEGLPAGLIRHCSATGAILRCPEYALDMVRPGIALYDDYALPGVADTGLSESMRWITHAVHVKTLGVGESVGYSRAFICQRPTKVMTLPIGYADGYPRRMAGKAHALVRSQKVPLIGRVCMDQIMLDVTEIAGATVGDEVVLLGQQGKERITVRDIAAWGNMIDHEVFTSPSPRFPRVYK